MSNVPITLEYELTPDDMRASFERLGARIRPSWFRRIGSLLALWVLIDGWDAHSLWFKVILVLLAVHFWTSPRSFYWVGRFLMRVLPAPGWTANVLVEMDDRGLRVHHRAQKNASPVRYWWSRLSRVEETDFGIELYFDSKDWSELQIPSKAFASDDRRREFFDLVHEKLKFKLSADRL